MEQEHWPVLQSLIQRAWPVSEKIFDSFPLAELLCHQRSWNNCSPHSHTTSTSDDITKNIYPLTITVSQDKVWRPFPWPWSNYLVKLLTDAFLHLLHRAAILHSKEDHTPSPGESLALSCWGFTSCFTLMKVTCKLILNFYSSTAWPWFLQWLRQTTPFSSSG